MTRTPGCALRTASICCAVKRTCTEQWPFHRMRRAFSTASRVRPPNGSNGSHTTISSSGTPIFQAVLRPRCWSGRNRIFSRCDQPHLSEASAFDEVQMVPPRSPTNDLIDAAELM